MKARRLDAGQISTLAGIVLAIVLCVLVNVVAGRHYKRWDWTTSHRYTLSPATLSTLHALPEPIQIWVLLGGADPMEQSVKQLLVAYGAETTRLDIRYVDPDRDVVALEDVRKRFKIETGRTEDGHVVADAIVVVARGERHWFLSTSDMIEVAGTDDTQVKPKEERAMTGAIRNVLGSAKTKLCFTSGHGEMSPDDPGPEGAGALKEVLVKDNYEVGVVDPGAPGNATPFAGCEVAVVAGPRGAFGDDESERLRTWLLEGGNLLLAAAPITSDGPTGLAGAKLERVLAPFGIVLDEDVVVEVDPALAYPNANGIRFVAGARPHATTAALVKDDRHDVPRIAIQLTRSLRGTTEPGSASASEVLFTSKDAFGLTSVAGAATWRTTPAKSERDLPGPLTIAMAAERPRVRGTHGPRAVVLGSASPLASPAFREPMPTRGAALLAENAVSWLASKPEVLDVPDRPAIAAGIRISEDDRGAVRRYVVFLMPGTAALLGIVIGLWRRRSEGALPEDEPERKK